ncbi:class I adenylate-forming enzyme family protein [Actibacterium pelagium]|uniref:2-succinylbenzoate-CoA ligase n=1 Tax=Actibacterium pelagium TaxID=2029103 RepID=A0A917ELL9_9RHOB|nr:class I adenylate-forming enzyme family protein [Actibacterium pelagium]GGE59085.1 2-succinylbenzoate-CoA ligase [Actibacterium pelagium]
METLSTRFETTSQAFSSQIAMFELSGTPVRYENFFFTVISFAETLIGLGVRPEMRVSIHVPDHIATTALNLAVLRLGATLVIGPLNLVRARPDLAEKMVIIRQVATGDPREILMDQSWIRPPTRMIENVGNAKMIRATSGTTGIPKLRLTDEASLLLRDDYSRSKRGSPDGPCYVGVNTRSATGFSNVMRVYNSGQKQVHQLAELKHTLSAMEQIDVNYAYIPPLHFLNLLNTAKETGIYPRNLKKVFVGGGRVEPSLATEAETFLGCEVWNTYGSTETGSMAHARPSQHIDLPGCVGHVYEDRSICFRNGEGEIVSSSEGGHLWVTVPEGFQVSDFDTGQPICDDDGWLDTGDIGYIEDDLLILSGRQSEFLNLGGDKRAPSRIENVVRVFDGIRDVVAFAVCTDTGIDEIGIAIVPEDGFDLGNFQKFLDERFGQKYKTQVILIDNIPMTETGKVDRQHLSQTYSGTND